MKTRRLLSVCYVLFVLSTIAGCKQDAINKPNLTNTNPPGVVTNVTAVGLNGKAAITYTLPGDKDLLYVKAVYEIVPGRAELVKASSYTNTLTVEGFGDTLAHTIKLYAVNSSEIASAPVTVTVHPLTPAIYIARRSLKVIATFGGFSLTCNNPAQENLAVIPLVDTTGNGKWVQTKGMDNIYSNAPVITSIERGQPATTRKYAFVVRDRWLNQSDTLFTTLTPLFEMLLPKSTWSNYVLQGDATIAYPATNVQKTYDGAFNSGLPLFTVENSITPPIITYDLGKAYVFSRFQINPYLELGNVYYVRGNQKDFEIWGSNNPNLSGALDASWTLLTTSHVVKPSGLPMNTETAADQLYAYNGWQFDFPVTSQSYRYVRIRSLQNWMGSNWMSLREFTLWGN